METYNPTGYHALKTLDSAQHFLFAEEEAETTEP